MKQVLLTVLLMFGAEQVLAECYHFVNQNGPTQIGLVSFQHNGQVFKATQVCTKRINGFAGIYDSVSFSDAEGSLMVVATKKSTGRCGPTRDCLRFEGNTGQALGKNLSSYEAQSIDITIDVDYKSNLGLKSGIMTDNKTNKKYLILETKNTNY